MTDKQTTGADRKSRYGHVMKTKVATQSVDARQQFPQTAPGQRDPLRTEVTPDACLTSHSKKAIPGGRRKMSPLQAYFSRRASGGEPPWPGVSRKAVTLMPSPSGPWPSNPPLGSV